MPSDIGTHTLCLHFAIKLVLLGFLGRREGVARGVGKDGLSKKLCLFLSKVVRTHNGSHHDHP